MEHQLPQPSQSDPKARIIELHKALENYARKTIATAVEIGRLLVVQKKNLPHGQFEEWVEESLPFSTRNARRFMQLYHGKEILRKTDNVSDLTLAEALRLIAEKTEPLAHDYEAAQIPPKSQAAYDDGIDAASVTSKIVILTATLEKAGSSIPFHRRIVMKPLIKDLIRELKKFVNDDELTGEFVEGEIVS